MANLNMSQIQDVAGAETAFLQIEIWLKIRVLCLEKDTTLFRFVLKVDSSTGDVYAGRRRGEPCYLIPSLYSRGPLDPHGTVDLQPCVPYRSVA